MKYQLLIILAKGLPKWLSHKESNCQCRRHGFDPWVSQDPLEEEMATDSSILAWEIPRTEESGSLQSMGSQRIRPDFATKQQPHINGLMGK